MAEFDTLIAKARIQGKKAGLKKFDITAPMTIGESNPRHKLFTDCSWFIEKKDFQFEGFLQNFSMNFRGVTTCSSKGRFFVSSRSLSLVIRTIAFAVRQHSNSMSS
jgi:hypothetical protein